MKIFIVFILIFLFSSCDPEYSILVFNGSQSDVILKTNPSLESVYGGSDVKQGIMDNYKVGQVGENSIYRIKPGDTLRVYGYLGFHPAAEHVPFSYVEFQNSYDTIKLNGKEEIFNKIRDIMIQKRKSKFYLNFPLKN